jgi:YggT family protein
MDVVVVPLIHGISYVIYLYGWVLIIMVVMSWLVQFNILNTRQRFVYMAMDVLYRLTNPALRPIRRVIPDLGGLDISPIILIIILFVVQDMLGRLSLRLEGI